jgi:hypothetical protein
MTRLFYGKNTTLMLKVKPVLRVADFSTMDEKV